MTYARVPVRPVIVLTAVLSLALALAACGDDDDDSGATATTTAASSAATSAAATTTAAGGGASSGAQSATEVIKGIAFTEKEVRVGLGGSVEFDNQDSQAHTATADDGLFDTGRIEGGSKTTIVFAEVGTFPFHCAIHPSMKASVIVT
jgi:plastocyanin